MLKFSLLIVSMAIIATSQYKPTIQNEKQKVVKGLIRIQDMHIHIRNIFHLNQTMNSDQTVIIVLVPLGNPVHNLVFQFRLMGSVS